jgi:ankyrin repeat protein
MKYLLTIILTTVTSFALLTNVTKANTTDIVLSDNIIEAINSIDIVSLNVLLAEGADIDIVDENGNTPLMIASKIGNPRMVKIILAHSPDVNRQNNQGNSALMIASEHGQFYIAGQLVRFGANISAKNNAGLTAADIALRNGQPQIADLLRSNSEVPVTR